MQDILAPVRPGLAGRTIVNLCSETPERSKDAARNLDTGVHPGDLSTVTMMGATADHIVGAREAAGVDVELPRVMRSHNDRAIAAGDGRDNWTSCFEIIKAPAVAVER